MPLYSIFDMGFDPWMRKGASDLPIPTLADSNLSTSGVSSIGGTPTVAISTGAPLLNPISQTVTPESIQAGEMGSIIGHGKKTFLDTQAGFLQGLDSDGTYKWIIGVSGSSIDWNVTTANTLTVVGSISVSAGGTVGGFDVGSDYIRDVANSFGLASTVTGGDDVRFWAGATFANRATAPLRITEAGVIVGTSATFTGTLNATGGYIGSTTALVYEAQGINTGVTGYIRGGQTAYNTGTGYFLGYSGAAYKFSIGDTTTANSLTWDGTTLSVNGSAITGQDLFGDGTDGSVTYSGDTTLTTDLVANNVTVDSGVILTTGGYRIFAKGTLTNNGTIRRNGNAGSNGGDAGAIGAGGTALASGSIFGAHAGGAGGEGRLGAGTNGSNGTTVSLAINTSSGAQGGPGGSGGAAAGNGGSAGTVTGTILNRIRVASFLLNLHDFSPSLTQVKSAAGSGGGGGGGGDGGGNIGGGGGGAGTSGGIVSIFARIIVNTGTISANGAVGGIGGSGAAGLGGSGGGGAGGNGGAVLLCYQSLTNSGTISASAGNGGAGGTGGAGGGGLGTAGNNGSAGSVIQLQV